MSKTKRKKPFAANLASTKSLEAEGWTVATVEHRIPHTFITKDLFGFADLLAFAPRKGIMLVQVTGGPSRSNFNARIEKVKSNPYHYSWILSGGRIQVHNWLGTGNLRALEVFNVEI